MSILAKRVPRPSCIMKSIASSTRAYESVKSSPLMPSLTLFPAGCERSTISLHLPDLLRLGITPNLLTWRAGRGGRGKGPATLPRWTSRDKYSSTTWGFWRADCMFCDADWSPAMRDGLKPILKPWRKPDRRY